MCGCYQSAQRCILAGFCTVTIQSIPYSITTKSRIIHNNLIHKCRKCIFDAKFMEINLNLILKLSPDKNLSKCTIVKRVFVIIVDLIIYVGTQSRKTKAFAYLLKGLVCSTVQWIRFHLCQGFIKFRFSKKATKIVEIFTLDLTLCSKRQIYDGDFVSFCGLLRKSEL